MPDLHQTVAAPAILTTAQFHAAALAAVSSADHPIAVFDCDGTLWSGDAGSGFMRWSIAKGILPPAAIAWLDEKYAGYLSGQVNELDICGQMVQVYRGLTESTMRVAAAEFFETEIAHRIFPELRALVAEMQSRGVDIWAVSSTNSWVIEEGVRRFNIPAHRVLAARVAAQNGVVTDTLLDVPTDEGKAVSLARIGITAPHAVFGNSIHDAAMLKLARGVNRASRTERAPRDGSNGEVQNRICGAFPVNPTSGLLSLSAARRWPVYYPASVAPTSLFAPESVGGELPITGEPVPIAGPSAGEPEDDDVPQVLSFRNVRRESNAKESAFAVQLATDNNMLLEGLHIPLTTPFQADGRVALTKLAANVARYSKTPAAGLIVLGPSGESTLLSDDETREVLSIAAQAAAQEKVLIAGIARDSVRSVLALADFAAEQHYDAILVGSPSHPVLNAGSDYDDFEDKNEEEIRDVLSDRARKRSRVRMAYFQTIADRSPLPIVLLRAPNRILSMREAAALASHRNVLGVLNAVRETLGTQWLTTQTASIKRDVTVTPTFTAVTARMQLEAAEMATVASLVPVLSLTASVPTSPLPPFVPALRTRTKSVGFQILGGNSGSLLDALNAGATGIAPAFAAAAPQACYEIYAAWKDAVLNQDSAAQTLAEEKQARIREAAALAESLGPGGLKYGCDLNGYAAGLPRLPHLPPTGEQRAALEALTHPLRN